MNFQVNVPTKINFGTGEILRLGEICSPFGNKALVITMTDLVELGVHNCHVPFTGKAWHCHNFVDIGMQISEEILLSQLCVNGIPDRR